MPRNFAELGYTAAPIGYVVQLPGLSHSVGDLPFTQIPISHQSEVGQIKSVWCLFGNTVPFIYCHTLVSRLIFVCLRFLSAPVSTQMPGVCGCEEYEGITE